VDVFAKNKYAGNQLAVVCNAKSLSQDDMQKIANELHFSETAFILSDKKNNHGYDVRIFTPKAEVPFAGHPTLGTAYIIKKTIADKNEKEVILNLKVGKITVTFENFTNEKQILWMKQIPARFGKTFQRNIIQNLLGIDETDIDEKYPVEEISTGLPFIIVPLRDLTAVKKVKINQNMLLQTTKNNKVGVLVFSPQAYQKQNQLNVRVFVDAFGIPEDPATGSANGCLAAYLSKYNYFGAKDIDIRVEQGFEINRPSILRLKTKRIGKNIEIYVGGRVFLIAEGKFI
jgi:trans-2,3-dihydro-3-hydroxyanthranilate isomerase